ADGSAVPAENHFENGDDHSQRVAAENGALGDLRYVFGLGDRDGESVTCVDVQHHVNIGAAIADVHNVVRRHLEGALQFVQDRDLAVARNRAHDAVDLS